MAVNDITGDKIQSRVQNQKYADNWDRIFNKGNKDETMSRVSDSKSLQQSKKVLAK